MGSNTKTYQVDKHKQLIPLNGTTVNFACFFEVKSKGGKPFQMAIVEQGELKPKQYKLAENGSINGQFESDGQLKSYFMVLKAQEPCECNVQIILKPKEVKEQPQPPEPQPAPSFVHAQEHARPSTHTDDVMVVQKQESYFQPKYIIGISLAIIAVYLLYRYRKAIFGKLVSKDTLAPSFSNTSF